MSLDLSAKWTENTYIKENWLFQLFNQDSYLSFDGDNDYIDLGATTSATATSLTSTTDMSIAFWIQFTGASQWIYVNNSVDNKYAGVGVYVDHEKKFSLLYGDNTGTTTSDYIRFKTTSAYSDDTWYHVVITTGFALNGSDTVFYVNGSVNSTVVASSMSTVSTPTYTSGNSYIGRANPPDPDSYGELKIKNLAIWTGIIDATNVGAIYNSGNFLSLADDSGSYDESSNLKAYWEFNNGNNKAIDLTDNISPGTISGAKYGGFLGLSFYDTALESVDYYGAILNKPSIRESINLENSTAKTSNVSLSVANFKHLDDDLSAELFGGSRNYINRPVKVYIQPNDDVDLADCLQIYNGRLTDVSHNASKLSLRISAVMPWDNISIPQTKSSDKNLYFPIAYGNFTPNSTGNDYNANKTLRPMPVNEFRGTQLYSLISIEDVTSNAYPHYYDKSFDRFIPVSEDGSYNFDTDADSYKGGYAVQAHYELEKRIKFKPVETTSSTGWTNPDNAFDSADADETTMVTVWIAISDADENNGCLQVIPHQLNQNLLPHCSRKQLAIADEFIDPSQAIPLPVRAGGLIVFHPLTVHSSLENDTENFRWSFDLRYNRTGEPTGRSHFPEFVARSILSPERVLTDWQEWKQMWEEARSKLAKIEHIPIHRWKSNSPHCA